jgi:pyridoxal biosynthesis lyase PdxS
MDSRVFEGVKRIGEKKGINTLSKKVGNLEKRVAELEMVMRTKKEPGANRIREAVQRYLKTSNEVRGQWKGVLSAVEEVRVMRRHEKEYCEVGCERKYESH